MKHFLKWKKKKKLLGINSIFPKLAISLSLWYTDLWQKSWLFVLRNSQCYCSSCTLTLPSLWIISLYTRYIGKCSYFTKTRISTWPTYRLSKGYQKYPKSFLYDLKTSWISMCSVSTVVSEYELNKTTKEVMYSLKSVKGGLLYRKASHHSFRQPKQSPCCLVLAPHVSFSQSRKSSSSFFNTRNCPSTTYACREAETSMDFLVHVLKTWGFSFKVNEPKQGKWTYSPCQSPCLPTFCRELPQYPQEP